MLLSGIVDVGADSSLPWGTLLVNVTGSLAIGFYAAVSAPGGARPTESHRRQFVMTGICGGYTTFSIFSLETARLVEAGGVAAAASNIGLSIGGAVAAVWLGHVLGSAIAAR